MLNQLDIHLDIGGPKGTRIVSAVLLSLRFWTRNKLENLSLKFLVDCYFNAHVATKGSGRTSIRNIKTHSSKHKIGC